MWARLFPSIGDPPRLMSPQFFSPSLWLARLRIGQRLALRSTLVLLLLFAAGVAQLNRLDELSAALNQLSSQRLELLRLAEDVSAQANRTSRKLLVLISARREQRVAAYTEVDRSERLIDAAMQRLQQRLQSSAGQAAYRELADSLRVYRTSYARNVDLIELGELEAARAMMAEETEQALAQLAAAAEHLLQLQQTETVAHARQLEAEIQQDRLWLLLLGATLLLAGTLTDGFVRRSITVPLDRVEHAAQLLAAGDYSARAELSRDAQGNIDSRDEVARLGKALNDLAAAVAEREQRLRQLANTDAMTGLAQRARFLVEANEQLQQRAAAGLCSGLLCLDLDRLKTINALLGFDAGDAVIRRASSHLQKQLGLQAPLARLAGGTFAALLSVRDAADAQAQAEALRQGIEQQLDWQGHRMDLSISCGAALCPENATDAEALLRQAEQALFESKRAKSGLRFYSAGAEQARQQDLSLASDLQAALQGEQLHAFLQPKLRLGSEELEGAEALVRWKHPSRGWMPPSEFIPFAERTGRVSQLTRWMLEQALRMLADPRMAGLHIAVNISTQDLQNGELLDDLRAMLARHAVDPQQLTLELTETGLMDSSDDPVALLHGLRTLGVRLSIDDFGTGHSSLAYLQRLPVDELKIDRTFVREVDLAPRRYELLATIVRLGHSLGLTVTAEGIERPGELEAVRRLGCDQVQGFLIGRPMEFEAFLAWREARGA